MGQLSQNPTLPALPLPWPRTVAPPTTEPRLQAQALGPVGSEPGAHLSRHHVEMAPGLTLSGNCLLPVALPQEGPCPALAGLSPSPSAGPETGPPGLGGKKPKGLVWAR